MQNTNSIGITIPLDCARHVRSVGQKALDAGRLYTHGFAVPYGFVISSDAYHAHLWATGARPLARESTEPDFESIQDAILSAAIPKDVWRAIESAYDRLGDNATVAVRHSATDERVAGSTYSTLLGVRGARDLVTAIKQVWASLWNEDAVELRSLTGESFEPAMAIFVQIMVDSVVSGVASSVNPETGDPTEIAIRSMWGVYSVASDADEFTVDLEHFRLSRATTAHKETLTLLGAEGIEIGPAPAELVAAPSLSHAEMVELAETALWVESALGGRVSINWANDGKRFLILGAKPADSPEFFPAESTGRVMRSVSNEPISPFAQSLIQSAPNTSIKLTNARAYLPARDKTGSVAASARAATRAIKHYHEFASAAQQISRAARPNLATAHALSTADLVARIAACARAAEESLGWMSEIIAEGSKFKSGLRHLLQSLGADPSLPGRLLVACERENLQFGQAFQRLATYVWQSRDDYEFAPSPEDVAEDLARAWGYSFASARDAFDPAVWQSWAENPEQPLAIAFALARGPLNDIYLGAAHSVSSAAQAEEEALELISEVRGAWKKKSVRRRFDLVLECARLWRGGWVVWQQVHALALTSLRVNTNELGARLVDSAVLSERSDIFYLTVDEISQVRSKMEQSEISSLRRSVAARKHELWLMGRLNAPRWLPMDAKAPPTQPPTHARIITGQPASNGSAVGPARLAQTLDEAIKLQPGEILIAGEFAPAWTPLLCLAGGLVLTGDDTLGAAKAARHYGIPCVTGLSGLERIIRPGATVMVDGTAGVVEIVRK